MHDQAEGLRRGAGAPLGGAAPVTSRLRCVAIGSGKGGVGKTAITIGLGQSLAKKRQRVLMLDADLGLANIDIQMGLEPLNTLQDVVYGHASLESAIVRVDEYLDVLPSSSGTPEMADMGNARRQMLATDLLRFANRYDFLLIDAGAGIGQSVTGFLGAAPEVLVVVVNEPTSIMDAYSLVKVLSKREHPPQIRIVANMVRSMNEAASLAERIETIAERFLGIKLPLAGAVVYDPCVRDAIRQRKTIIDYAPRSAPAQCLEELAGLLMRGPANIDARTASQLFGQLVDISLQSQEERAS